MYKLGQNDNFTCKNRFRCPVCTRHWAVLKKQEETGRNGRKQEESGRTRKKKEDTGRNRKKKQEKTGINKKETGRNRKTKEGKG